MEEVGCLFLAHLASLASGIGKRKICQESVSDPEYSSQGGVWDDKFRLGIGLNLLFVYLGVFLLNGEVRALIENIASHAKI